MNNFPDFYDPERVGTLFYPNMAQIAAAAETAGLRPATFDEQSVHLVIIDMQVDFCHEEGSLFVPGAPADLRRLIEFIFKYSGSISQITCTLDSHLPFQIFHPAWWRDVENNPPDPLTIITVADVEEGRWHPVIAPEYSVQYVQKLEAQSKKQLTIWPYHVLLGSLGNVLDPSLFTAVAWHALARHTQPTWVHKGTIPQTEHYSAIQPEIAVEDQPERGKNLAFLQSIEESDVVVIAGEAESHCVLETLKDIVAEFGDDRSQLEKIYVLQDCMSPVQHPEVDFHAIALEEFAGMAEAGIHFINSSDPIPAFG